MKYTCGYYMKWNENLTGAAGVIERNFREAICWSYEYKKHYNKCGSHNDFKHYLYCTAIHYCHGFSCYFNIGEDWFLPDTKYKSVKQLELRKTLRRIMITSRQLKIHLNHY